MAISEVPAGTSDVGDGVVAVIGGGIAGLCTALALHREGARVQVLESQTECADGGFGINLPGNAIRAFGELGIERGELVAAGHPVARREYRNAENSLLFSIDESGFWGGGVRAGLLASRPTDRLVAQSAAHRHGARRHHRYQRPRCR
ncbi:FAD-dependent oxidoreductase [Mycobacterium sp. NPDC003449]